MRPERTQHPERFERLMNHFLREGFEQTTNNRLSQGVDALMRLDIEKSEDGWLVTVEFNHSKKEQVRVTTEQVLWWLYHRSFK